jgi:hypothetical protein
MIQLYNIFPKNNLDQKNFYKHVQNTVGDYLQNGMFLRNSCDDQVIH